eukprot:2880877-Prymnesium_polylepis.1
MSRITPSRSHRECVLPIHIKIGALGAGADTNEEPFKCVLFLFFGTSDTRGQTVSDHQYEHVAKPSQIINLCNAHPRHLLHPARADATLSACGAAVRAPHHAGAARRDPWARRRRRARQRS